MADGETRDNGVCFDPKLEEAVLANDLNKMTVDERDFVYDDVHGVRSLPVEERNPSRMMESLDQMDRSVNRLLEPNMVAFRKAITLDSQYVLRDRLFRIRFLRADEFDAAKAARRFLNYLEFSYEIFGDVALMRPIRFDDLTKDEQNILREGSQQLLPCRDRSGRRILVRMGNMRSPDERQYNSSLLRISLYMMQVLASDEKTQQLGCVMVFTTGELDRLSGTEETRFLLEPNIKDNIRKFIATFPVRVSALHFCMPDTLPYQMAATALTLIAPSIMRVRVRKHMGSQTEYRYSLMSFGIPGDQLPITASGRIKTTNHQRWIRFQREKEDTLQMGLPPFQGVDCPRGMDILIGNAGHSSSYFRNNPGNTVYRELLEQQSKHYEAASDAQQKTRITWKVFEDLRSEGGRILVRDRRGWWEVASDDKSREKIAHDFRELRKKMAAAEAAQKKKKRRSVVDLEASTSAFASPEGFLKKRCLVNPDNIRSASPSGSNSNSDSDEAGCMKVFR